MSREHPYVAELEKACRFLGAPNDKAVEFIRDLEESRLVPQLGERAKTVNQFAQARIEELTSMHLFRTFLYVLVRVKRPQVFLETGVLHGFGSSFILQAMEHNGFGRLISVDLPHTGGEYEAQGSSKIPEGVQPGWAIPDNLRSRHDLRFGRAEFSLPAFFLSEPTPDIFMHDSDHSYDHMMFEMSLAWKFLKPSSVLVVDNIEANSAYQDFVAGVGCTSMIVTSYPPEHPEYWLHGLAIR